jgi:hypothetical protein
MLVSGIIITCFLVRVDVLHKGSMLSYTRDVKGPTLLLAIKDSHIHKAGLKALNVNVKTSEEVQTPSTYLHIHYLVSVRHRPLAALSELLLCYINVLFYFFLVSFEKR